MFDFSANQIIRADFGGKSEQLLLPAANREVLPGMRWGLAVATLTPAYWAAQLWLHREKEFLSQHQWGESLAEEVVACLLGGHGITYEMNFAAFERLQQRGLLTTPPAPLEAYSLALLEPLEVAGRRIRYRYPNQKAKFIHAALVELGGTSREHCGDRDFRDWLVGFKGIGHKTASWITRNVRSSDEVAIIDIHVYRAGVICGLFSGKEVLPRDYLPLEDRYLRFSAALGADPKRLDLLMWKQMRGFGDLALSRYRRAC